MPANRHIKNMAEHMTQEEIDRLMESLGEGEVDVSPAYNSVDSIKVSKKNKAVLSAIKRLEYSRENKSYEDEAEAKKAFHWAAFDLWLANRNMIRRDYYWMMNQEFKKRNMPFRFIN